MAGSFIGSAAMVAGLVIGIGAVAAGSAAAAPAPNLTHAIVTNSTPSVKCSKILVSKPKLDKSIIFSASECKSSVKGKPYVTLHKTCVQVKMKSWVVAAAPGKKAGTACDNERSGHVRYAISRRYTSHSKFRTAVTYSYQGKLRVYCSATSTIHTK